MTAWSGGAGASRAVLADLAGTCGDPARAVCRWVLDRTGSDGLAGASDFLVRTPLQVLLILLGAFVVNRIVGRAITRLVVGLRSVRQRTRGEGRDQRFHTISGVLRAAASGVIWTIAAVTALQEIGVQLGGLVAGATVVGAAVGFGAQALVRDFLSGFFLLVEDQFVVGDRIDLGMVSGKVERVTLRVTQLRDDDGTVWYVPNGRIERVANCTQGYNMATLDVPVAPGADLEAARQAIAHAAAEVCADPLLAPLVLAPPEGPDGVHDFDGSKVVLRVSVRVSQGSQWSLMRALRARVLAELAQAGVALAPVPAPAAEGA